jgi:hypothetical protein
VAVLGSIRFRARASITKSNGDLRTLFAFACQRGFFPLDREVRAHPELEAATGSGEHADIVGNSAPDRVAGEAVQAWDVAALEVESGVSSKSLK